MCIKGMLVTIAAGITLTGVGAFVASDKAMCGIARRDGSICQRIVGGEPACKDLGGKWDSKNSCCEIQGI